MEELCQQIAAALRRAEGDYNARLTGLANAANAAQRLARELQRTRKRAPAVAARPTFLQVMRMRLMGPCHPMCCNASYVRAVTIQAKYAMLQVWSSRDPEVAGELSTQEVEALLVPHSRLLALATAEMFAHAPKSTAVHLPVVSDALTTHPRWQVREALVRAVGRAGLSRPPRRLVEAIVRAIDADERQLAWSAKKVMARWVG